MLITLQGKDLEEEVENDDSFEDEPLPTPGLNNLSNIGEEFSPKPFYSPKKRLKITQYCVKNNVIYLLSIV